MDLPRLLILLIVAGAAVTLLVAPAVWYADQGRQVRRGLKTILRGEPHGYLLARGRGRGFGLNFTSNEIAVTWDQGAWGLLYPLEQLIGIEAIADGQVVGRVHRGETRRALDSLGGAEARVALRLVFDDVAAPEFVVDLWLPEDEGRRDAYAPSEALEECNRWLARVEALFRRPTAMRPSTSVAASLPATMPTAPSVQAALRLSDPPPWEDNESENAIT